MSKETTPKLTKREYFAAQALPACIARWHDRGTPFAEEATKHAVEYADALISALEDSEDSQLTPRQKQRHVAATMLANRIRKHLFAVINRPDVDDVSVRGVDAFTAELFRIDKVVFGEADQ